VLLLGTGPSVVNVWDRRPIEGNAQDTDAAQHTSWEDFGMNANVAWRVPAWRSFVWVGVVASVFAWALAWVVGRGAQAFMVIVAIAAVALAYRAVSGMRLALVGLMLAGFVMFLASLYWMFAVLMPTANTSPLDLLAMSVLPMASAAVLLLGAVSGYRHSQDA
jgi:hypothetical protein